MTTTGETYCVYMHIFPNNMKYVGITEFGDNPNERWKNGFGYTKNVGMFYDIVKYGWDNIKHEILYSNLSKQNAEKIESQLIKELDLINNGYNRSNGFKGNYNKGTQVMCVETGEKFRSKTEARKAAGIRSDSAFWKALDNPNRTCGGCHWITIT